MSVNRREFLQSSGAVVVYFSLAACESSVALTPSSKFDNRITVNADGSVELFMGKVELGQGIGTALAQIAADELGVAFESVRLVTVIDISCVIGFGAFADDDVGASSLACSGLSLLVQGVPVAVS